MDLGAGGGGLSGRGRVLTGCVAMARASRRAGAKSVTFLPFPLGLLALHSGPDHASRQAEYRGRDA